MGDYHHPRSGLGAPRLRGFHHARARPLVNQQGRRGHGMDLGRLWREGRWCHLQGQGELGVRWKVVAPPIGGMTYPEIGGAAE